MERQATAQSLPSSFAKPADSGEMTAALLARVIRARTTWLAVAIVAGLAFPGKALALIPDTGYTDPPAPAFTIEKLQKIDGVGSFTTAPLTGKIGQTVDYQIVVKNSGNTSLTFSDFKDANCEGISGGPSRALGSGESATYSCHHTLTAIGSWENEATVTGTYSESYYCGGGGDSQITHTSNRVLASVPVEPAFTIEKLQSIEGTGTYTKSPLTGKIGQTVDYEILVKNTGNTSLTFSDFKDANCEGISGGPSKALLPGESATYSCHHTLTAIGSWENEATVTGTPHACSPVTHTSNKVVTNVPNEPSTPPPGPSVQPPAPTAAVAPAVASAPPLSPAPNTKVLAFAAVSPTLSGAQGCVRSSFNASVSAPGVRSVTFWLNGHRLGTVTEKSAHGGKLSLRIAVAHLPVGAHRLLAKITVKSGASSTKLVDRTLTFLRCASPVIKPSFTG